MKEPSTGEQVAAVQRPVRARELPRRIVLTGFMGAGKTTVGRLLARQLGWHFVDLDDSVEAAAGTTMALLFAERGEGAMRQIESAALAGALCRREVVLALGGGTLESLRNRLLLEQTPGSHVVHLEGPFATLLDRCLLQSFATPEHIRPLVASPAEAESRFAARRGLYLRAAHRVVATDGQSPDAIAAALVEALRGGAAEEPGLAPRFDPIPDPSPTASPDPNPDPAQADNRPGCPARTKDCITA